VRTLRVLVADDHALVRKGIGALLERLDGVELVGEAANGREALRLVAERHPDVAFVNISMPELNGLETLSRLAKDQPRTRVVMLSMHADAEYVRRALALGASGYLLKDSELVELDLALRAVARGDVWLSPSVSKVVVEALSRGEAPPEPFELLTSRQREILQLVAEGLSTKDIAVRLDLSVKTVEAHRSQLQLRLGVRGVPALVRCAIRLGIVRPGL
jgi:DNA-binding NarL/FixJ family response regulator